MFKLKLKFTSTQTIIGSFVIMIFLGALLLSLPISSKSGTPTNFLTCIFTSTSAMCVTGLVLVDTATHWSMFGQLVILVLIQIGGLGTIFAASIIAMILGQKINLLQRTTLQEALSLQKVGGIVKLTRFIIKGVLVFEGIGAVLLFTRFIKDFDFFTAIWYSIFHSISAFCNAGFDLMGIREKFSSLTYYQSDLVVNLTIMSMIVIGGLGFSVWQNISNRRFNVRKYSLQTKIVLLTTALLIIVPALYFYAFEYKDMNGLPRVLVSLFQSVTTRTAGFNSADFNEMSEVGKAISIMLMLIGGSPGSTAGGMKTTTFFVLIISTIGIYKRDNEAHIFNRRIEMKIVRNAMTIFVLYLTLFLFSGFAICIIEKTTLLTALFEVASAVGTVGLTLGITTSVSTASKIILSILMLLGRVGGLTFIYAIVPSLNMNAGYISEDVTVG